MYRVIAYHGTGERSEVQHDLQALWCNLRHFANIITLKHIYCFQAMDKDKEVNLLLVIQYASKTESQRRGLVLEANKDVDYWFYVREHGYDLGNEKRRV